MTISRRRLLVGGGALGVVAVAGGVGLVEEGVLPGRQRLHRALGGCGSMAPVPDAATGPVVSGTFTSTARAGKEVGWTIAYPPGSDERAALPVCLALHGRGSDHTWVFDVLSLQFVLADAVERGTSPPFAIASVDGGDTTNWHRRADGDDPPTMITDELLPMLSARGLDTGRVGLWGWSLGGFGALALATTMGPSRVAAVAASSPAVWATYGATQPGTFDDQADFAANDLFERTGLLD
ncbi:MAG: alpha/beta hydrolase-fold protein, partial [Acidimicrobiales bacterium]